MSKDKNNLTDKKSIKRSKKARKRALILEKRLEKAEKLREELKSQLSEQRELLSKRTEELKIKTGNFVEERIGHTLEHSSLEAPVLGGEPEPLKWYKLPLKKGMSGDGSEYHMYLKKGTNENLCIFFSGGGVAWNEYTAARPVTGGRVVAGLPNFYWNNLRPFTQIMNINIGITDNDINRNPFADWSFAVITYATGDFHVGNNDFEYEDESGNKQLLHFHGYKNFRESMKQAIKYFKEPKNLLIAGDSAGAFAVPALAGEIIEKYYNKCENITLLSDSALLLFDRWNHTARNLWRASRERWDAIRGSNITVEWYRALLSKHPNRFKCLYASSSHDYLLSSYLNDILNKSYSTNPEVQELFFRQLKQMVRELKLINPDFNFYINNLKTPIVTQGGTIHTIVREPQYYIKPKEGKSFPEWLFDEVNGESCDVGMELLRV